MNPADERVSPFGGPLTVQFAISVELGATRTRVEMFRGSSRVASEVIEKGQDDVERSIKAHVLAQHGVGVGVRTVERLTMELAGLVEQPGRTLEVKGRDAVSGLPASVVLQGPAVQVAALAALRDLVDCVAGLASAQESGARVNVTLESSRVPVFGLDALLRQAAGEVRRTQGP